MFDKFRRQYKISIFERWQIRIYLKTNLYTFSTCPKSLKRFLFAYYACCHWRWQYYSLFTCKIHVHPVMAFTGNASRYYLILRSYFATGINHQETIGILALSVGLEPNVCGLGLPWELGDKLSEPDKPSDGPQVSTVKLCSILACMSCVYDQNGASRSSFLKTYMPAGLVHPLC